MRISSNQQVDLSVANEIMQASTITQYTQDNFSLNDNISEMTDEKGRPTKRAYQTAVNKMNEFMEFSQKNSKFVFHDGLERFYVEIIDSKTNEVVKEIPPKELLNAYYEMQKLAGKMFDTKA